MQEVATAVSAEALAAVAAAAEAAAPRLALDAVAARRAAVAALETALAANCVAGPIAAGQERGSAQPSLKGQLLKSFLKPCWIMTTMSRVVSWSLACCLKAKVFQVWKTFAIPCWLHKHCGGILQRLFPPSTSANALMA